MKQGWEIKRLVDVCDLFTDGDWIESKDQSMSGVRLIQTGNIGVGFFKDRREKARWISDATFERLRCQEIEPGDCLVSRLPDPVGRSCIIPDTGDKMITAVDCTILRFDRSLLYVDFFNYWSQSMAYLCEVESHCTGATRKRISRKNLGSVKTPIPPLPEQKRIVAILDRCFEAIDKAKANVERNLQNSKDLFQSQLNQIFTQKGNGWVQKKLGDVCDLYQGLAINKKTKHLLVVKSSLPLLRIKDLRNNSEEQYVSENEYPKKSLVTKKDIIYTRTGSLGLVFRGRTGILHNNSFKVIPKHEVTNDFLFWWLKSDAFKSKILSLAMKMAQPDITHKIFKDQTILIPSIDQQGIYYEQIERLNSEVENLYVLYQQELEALGELKKSVLQKAFNGELTETEEAA